MNQPPTPLTRCCFQVVAAVAVLLAVLAAGGCVDLRIPDPNVRYIAFGDSATGGFAEGDYPDILRRRLGQEPASFAVESSGGETSGEGLERLRDLIAQQVFPNAEVLLYWEGGNDITNFITNHDPLLLLSPGDEHYPFTNRLLEKLDEIQANVEAAVEAGRAAGFEVYVATYFFLCEELIECDPMPLDILLPGQAPQANLYLVMLNERIRQAAARQDAILVDVEVADEELRATASNYANCNHLSAAGNEIVADLFFIAITASGE